MSSFLDKLNVIFNKKKAKTLNNLCNMIKFEFERGLNQLAHLILKRTDEYKFGIYIIVDNVPLRKFQIIYFTKTTIFFPKNLKVVNLDLGVKQIFDWWKKLNLVKEILEFVQFYYIDQEIKKLPMPIWEEIVYTPSFVDPNGTMVHILTMVIEFCRKRSDRHYYLDFAKKDHILVTSSKGKKIIKLDLVTHEYNCPDYWEDFEPWLAKFLN